MELFQESLTVKSLSIGKVFKNRTLVYLVPALSYYGSTFNAKLMVLPIKAFGIFDEDLKAFEQYSYRKSIYVLVDCSIKKSVTISVLNWFKNQEYYVDIVPYSNPEGDHKLLIIDFPEEFSGAYDNFILGKYSFMYSKEEVNKFFSPKVNEFHDKAVNVFNKTEKAALEHIQAVKKHFNADLKLEDLKGKGYQYDFPPKKEQEFFNYKE